MQIFQKITALVLTLALTVTGNLLLFDESSSAAETKQTDTVVSKQAGTQQKASALKDIRTVYVDTNGVEITKSKVDANIVVMDKVGGDSYEDNIVYDTIESTGTIKIRGNSTSAADKKPFNISFQKQKMFLEWERQKNGVCLLTHLTNLL